MKRFIALALIAMLAGVFTMSCEKDITNYEYNTAYRYDTTITIDTIVVDGDTAIVYDTTIVYDTAYVYDTTIVYDTTYVHENPTYPDPEAIYYAAVKFAKIRHNHYWAVTPPMGVDIIGYPNYLGIRTTFGLPPGYFRVLGQFQYYVFAQHPWQLLPGIYGCVLYFNDNEFHLVSMIM